jgi:hypothetical protein
VTLPNRIYRRFSRQASYVGLGKNTEPLIFPSSLRSLCTRPNDWNSHLTSGDKFNEGLAVIWAEVDGRTQLGYIDRRGIIAIEPRFDAAFDFIDGVAEVYFSEKVNSATGPVLKPGYGYIDKVGTPFM